MKYVLIGMVLLLAAAGVKIYFLADEVAALELTAELKAKEAAQDLATKLQAQATTHATVLLEERRRRLAVERDNDTLFKRVQEITDAKARLAQSVRLAVNSLFDRARDKFGAMPADPGGSVASRSTAGEEPLNQDLVRELAKAWTWCEAGWQRVKDIGVVQQACRP